MTVDKHFVLKENFPVDMTLNAKNKVKYSSNLTQLLNLTPSSLGRSLFITVHGWMSYYLEQ